MKLSKTLLLSAFVVIWISVPFIVEMNESRLRIWVLDVGQGDSILVVTPNKLRILIDGGSGSQILSELGQVLPPWVHKIDILILTHPHADHFWGLVDVLNRYEVDEVWWNPVSVDIYGFDAFVDLISELMNDNLIIRDVCRSDVAIEEDLEIRILWPLCGLGGKSWNGNVNDDSVVVLIEYRNFEMLLSGDAEIEVENQIIDLWSSDFEDIEVLKAGHHCSRTASGSELLEAFTPEVAICSCGEGNKFNHPHLDVLERYDNFGILYFRTDTNGRIMIDTDGFGWNVEPENG